MQTYQNLPITLEVAHFVANAVQSVFEPNSEPQKVKPKRALLTLNEDLATANGKHKAKFEKPLFFCNGLTAKKAFEYDGQLYLVLNTFVGYRRYIYAATKRTELKDAVQAYGVIWERVTDLQTLYLIINNLL